MPFQKGPEENGCSCNQGDYNYALAPILLVLKTDLTEPFAFFKELEKARYRIAWTTAGSPYYHPLFSDRPYFLHLMIPATPRIHCKVCARKCGKLTAKGCISKAFMWSGFGVFLTCRMAPNVAQNVLQNRNSRFDGLGRMVLSYPELPEDILAGKRMSVVKSVELFQIALPLHERNISGCFAWSVYKAIGRITTLKSEKAHEMP